MTLYTEALAREEARQERIHDLSVARDSLLHELRIFASDRTDGWRHEADVADAMLAAALAAWWAHPRRMCDPDEARDAGVVL